VRLHGSSASSLKKTDMFLSLKWHAAAGSAMLEQDPV
jgi:hypothetical protein